MELQQCQGKSARREGFQNLLIYGDRHARIQSENANMYSGQRKHYWSVWHRPVSCWLFKDFVSTTEIIRYQYQY